jgi:hypothetical protein
MNMPEGECEFVTLSVCGPKERERADVCLDIFYIMWVGGVVGNTYIQYCTCTCRRTGAARTSDGKPPGAV